MPGMLGPQMGVAGDQRRAGRAELSRDGPVVGAARLGREPHRAPHRVDLLDEGEAVAGPGFLGDDRVVRPGSSGRASRPARGPAREPDRSASARAPSWWRARRRAACRGRGRPRAARGRTPAGAGAASRRAAPWRSRPRRSLPRRSAPAGREPRGRGRPPRARRPGGFRGSASGGRSEGSPARRSRRAGRESRGGRSPSGRAGPGRGRSPPRTRRRPRRPRCAAHPSGRGGPEQGPPARRARSCRSSGEAACGRTGARPRRREPRSDRAGEKAGPRCPSPVHRSTLLAGQPGAGPGADPKFSTPIRVI